MTLRPLQVRVVQGFLNEHFAHSLRELIAGENEIITVSYRGVTNHDAPYELAC